MDGASHTEPAVALLRVYGHWPDGEDQCSARSDAAELADERRTRMLAIAGDTANGASRDRTGGRSSTQDGSLSRQPAKTRPDCTLVSLAGGSG
jgi:hypothetical protein